MQTDFTNAPEVREATALVAELNVSADYKIANAEEYSAGAEWLKRIKTAQKRLEALRTTITAPLLAAQRAANELFRRPTEALQQDERTIKLGMSRFEQEQDRLRREEQARADAAARKEQEKLAAQAAKAAASGKVEKAEQLAQRAATVAAPVISREPPKVSGISMRDVAKFEIVNVSLVPREFMVPDEKAIGAVVRALKDKANIPGVRVWMEKQIAAGVA